MASKLDAKDLVVGVDGLASGFANLNKQLEELATLLKSTQQSFDKQAKTQSDVAKTTNEVHTSNQKLNDIEKERVKLVNNLNKANSTAIDKNEKLKIQLAEQRKINKEFAKEKLGLIGAYEKESKKLNQLRKEYKDLAVQNKQNTAEGKALLKNITELDSKLKKVDSTVGQSQRNVGKYNSALKGLGRSILNIATAYVSFQAAINIFKKLISLNSLFTRGMSEVRAITGATFESFKRLRDNALLLGSTTEKTALEVAQLQKEFSKLGFTTDEILNVTEATINLSIAAGSDLAESAVVAAGTIRGFGESTKQTNRIVDVMAKSFTSSALDLEKFKTAMSVAAPVAKSFGVDVEFTTAQLSILADANLDASTAGTSLRNMFLELSARGLTWEEGLQMINDSTNKNTTALDLFGKRGATAALILADNTEKAAFLEKSYRNSAGAAKAMADIMADNLAGDAKKAGSAIEGLFLGLGSKLDPALRSVTQGFTRLVSKLNESLAPQRESVDLYGLENKELNLLFNTVKDSNLSNEARFKLIEKINTEYGSYLPSLLTEKSTLEDIEQAQKSVNKQFQLKIIQQAFQEQITDLLKQELEAKEGLVKAEIALAESNANRINLSKEELDIQQSIIENAKAINNSTIENNESEVESVRDKFKKIGELYGIAFSEIEMALEESVDKEVETVIEGERRKVRAIVDERRRLEQEKAALQSLGSQGSDIDLGLEAFEEQLDKKNKVEFQYAMSRSERLLELQKEQYDAELDLFEDNEAAKLQIREAFVNAGAQVASDQFSSFIDNNLNEFRTSQEAQEEALKNRLDKGLITERKYEQQLQRIRLRTRQEEAKAEKKKALFDIALNTAAAIIKQLGATPLPAGLPFVITVGAIGAAQAAVVASKPIPKFRMGGEHKGGVSEFSEEGPELFIDTKGNAILTPEKRTIGWMPKGEFFKHDSPETQMALSGGMTPEQYEGLLNEQRLTRKAIKNQKSFAYDPRTGNKQMKLNNQRTTYIHKFMRGEEV